MHTSPRTTTGAGRITTITVLLVVCLLPVGPTGRVPTTDSAGKAEAAVAHSRRPSGDPPRGLDVAAVAAAPTGTGTAPPPVGTTTAPRDRATARPETPPDAAGWGTRSSVPAIPAPAKPRGAGTPAPGAGYAWPLLPVPSVLAPFRAPTHAYGPGHRGVDLAGRADQPVLAARAGTVVFAGPVAGHGAVSVQHDDGLRTTYEPVSPAVPAGAVVRAGDVLGMLEAGHAGCRAAVCLHWGVRRDRLGYLDPLVLLGPTRVRLLPVPEPWPDGDPPSPP